MKYLVVLLAAIIASLQPNSANAGKSSGARSNRIQISYVAPKNADHESIFRLLKERQVLEQFKEL